MTLNFPSDISKPYVDPGSGLKYIFNGAVGAWETALQPPVFISDGPPGPELPGFLWWDSEGGSLYIYYDDGNSSQWVEAVPSAISKNSFVSRSAPTAASSGDTWWNTLERKLYIRVEDAWEDIGLRVNEFIAEQKPSVSFTHTEPTTRKRGDIWYSRAEGVTYIYSDEPDYTGWKALGGLRSETTSYGIRDILTGDVVKTEINDGVARLSIRASSTLGEGIIRIASQAEVNNGTGRGAVTPLTLRQALDNLPVRHEVATIEEVLKGESNDKVVTPQTLALVSSSVNPVGTVINMLGDEAPLGYLKCDGSAVRRSTYSDLFSLIGTKFGIGDGGTTFNLPLIEPGNHQTAFVKF